MEHCHILLAGGQSRRFGQPKAFKSWNGKLLYEWCKEAAGGGRTFIVSHPSLVSMFQERNEENILVDIDPFSGKGPLAGFYTAMHQIQSDYYAFFPCDTPLLQKRTIDLLKSEVQGFDAIVPIADGRIHPLVSVLHRDAKAAVYNQLLDNKLKTGDLFRLIRTKYIDVESNGSKSWEFLNINEEKDLRELNRIIEKKENR